MVGYDKISKQSWQYRIGIKASHGKDTIFKFVFLPIAIPQREI